MKLITIEEALANTSLRAVLLEAILREDPQGGAVCLSIPRLELREFAVLKDYGEPRNGFLRVSVEPGTTPRAELLRLRALVADLRVRTIGIPRAQLGSNAPVAAGRHDRGWPTSATLPLSAKVVWGGGDNASQLR